MILSSTSSIRQRADTLRSCSGSAKRRPSTWLPGLTIRITRTKPVRPNGSGRSLGRASFCGGGAGRSPKGFDLHAQSNPPRPFCTHHPSNFLARWRCRVIEGRVVDWERLGVGMGGIETMAAAIGADLAARLPRQNKKQREGLALLVATALDVRDVNLMELAAALPRAAERL